MALFDDTYPPFVPFGSRILAQETPPQRGTDVAVLQVVYNLMLRTMNPQGGPIGLPVPVSGVYDAATAAAVRAIQRHFGLTADGVVRPDTYWLFGQGTGPFVPYGGPAYGSQSLSTGAAGGDVLVLQNRLNVFRYARILGGPADGVFGPKTAAAVLAFKADAAAHGDSGFPNNAVVGFGTYDATWIYTFAGGRDIFSGRNGFDVVFVQVLLRNLGLYQGLIHGYYDATTLAAVKDFQRQQGLRPDGIIGPETFYQFGLVNNVAAPGPLAVGWPPAPPPVPVSVCSVGLAPLGSDLHPYGVASIVVNQAEGFESLDVTANGLPDPSSLGSSYGQYAFTLSDLSGTVLLAGLLTPLPTGSVAADWGGSVSPGVKTIPPGIVTVYPTVAGRADGPYGPPILQGSLLDCH